MITKPALLKRIEQLEAEVAEIKRLNGALQTMPVHDNYVLKLGTITLLKSSYEACMNHVNTNNLSGYIIEPT